MAVTTFEWRGGLGPPARHGSMAEASEALPRGGYTSLRTYRRDHVVRLDAHLQRLGVAVHAAPPAGSDLRGAVAEAIDACGFDESRLRVTWCPPRLFVSIEPFAPPARELYEHGVACATVAARRADPRAKDTAFIATAAEQYRALPAGVHEGLMVDADGSILEGLSSNVFFVLDAALRTEDARVLPGVTRGIVLELAGGLMPVRLEPVHRAGLARVEEAFLTSVSREVMPVVRVDGQRLGGGVPGPRTRAVAERFAELVRREARPARDA